MRLVVETMNAVIAAHDGPPLPYEKVGELTGLPLDAMFRLAWPDIGAADVELTPDDLREIDRVASNIEIQGARYPEVLEKRTGL